MDFTSLSPVVGFSHSNSMFTSGWCFLTFSLNALVSLVKNLLLINEVIDCVSDLPSTEVIIYLYRVVNSAEAPSDLFNLSNPRISKSIFFSSCDLSKVKTIDGKGFNNCMFPPRGPCADFQLVSQ